MSAMPDDATELRITASEARSDAKLAQLRSDSDTKFAQLRSDSDLKFAQVLGGIETMKAELGGKLDTLGARVDGLQHRLAMVESYAAGMKFWVIGTGVAVFGLTIAIFLGMFIGTFSSIYISAPMLVWLGVKPDSFLRHEDSDEPHRQPA